MTAWSLSPATTLLLGARVGLARLVHRCTNGRVMHHERLIRFAQSHKSRVLAGQKGGPEGRSVKVGRTSALDATTAAVVERARQLVSDLPRQIISITHSPQQPVAELAERVLHLGMAMRDIGQDLMDDAERLVTGGEHAE